MKVEDLESGEILSQAVVHGGLVHCSGQGALGPASGGLGA